MEMDYRNKRIEEKNITATMDKKMFFDMIDEIKERNINLEKENKELKKENEITTDIRKLASEILEVKTRVLSLEKFNDDKEVKEYETEIGYLKNYLKKEEEKNEALDIKNKENIEKQNELKRELLDLKKDLERIKKENIQLEEEKENKIVELKKDYENFKENLVRETEERVREKEESFKKVEQFLKWDKIYNKYLSLDIKVRDTLKGIFKGNNSMTFLYCGLKEENIENFWEYIKDRTLNNPENADVEILEEIFIEFFNAYNETFDKPIFEMQQVEEGQEFDDLEFIRTSRSVPVGEIKKILFHGYCRANDKRVIKKTIVIV